MLIPVLILMVSVRTLQVDGGELDKSEKFLAEFMRLQSDAVNLSWDVEKSVELLRNIFIKRIRCGSLQSIHQKICEDCLSVPRILNITREADSTVDNRSDRGQNITRIQDLGHAAVIFLNYFLSFQTACTVESIRFGYVGSCRVYNQCLAELHHYISPMKSSSYAEVLETVEHFLREIKIVYEPEPSQPCFSTEKILDELRTRSERHQHMPREIATVLLITSHLYLGECIDVGESVADFLDDIFLHYGDGCERVITQSGFTKLYNDLQMQRKGKHIDHGVPQNPCAFRDNKSHYLHATKTEDPSHHKDPNTNGGKRNNTSNISTDSMKNETMSEDLVFENDLNHTLKATEPNFGYSAQNVATRTVNQIQNKSRAAIWTPGSRLPVSSPSSESTNTIKVIPLTNDGTIYNVENITIQSENEGEPQNSEMYHSYMIKNVTDKNLENIATKIGATSSKRTVRHTISTEEHEHKNLANECLPSDDLLRRFLTNGNKVVTYAEFLQICPALVQQAVSGVCNSRLSINALSSEKTIFTGENETEVSLESAEAKGSTWHAVISVSAITAASLLGLVMLPALNRPFYVYVNGFFTGLAFGTMSGDVVLHIIPQYLGLHKHDEHGHEHEEESMLERYFPSHLQRQLTFWLTMYILFIAECIFSTLTGEKREHHGHSHDIPMKDMNVSSDVETADVEAKPPLCRRIVNFFKPSNICYGITSKAIVILLADTVHNFADGMAIAVGFSTSYKDGFSTSIAVFFHELPHEIGDFAVLLNSGLGYWRAFLFNLISGFSAFLGLGVGVFTASIFREWLLCITAGLFFFVVMGEMLPDMRLQSKEEWRVFIVKIVGTISGILTMICIAIYELSGV